VAALQPGARRRGLASAAEARQAAQGVLDEEQVGKWLQVDIEEEIEEEYRQNRPGRPGPQTEYRRIESKRYRIRLREEGDALAREALCDGLFPLRTNDETLSCQEALRKYKYQPFVEKRHEQLKSVFAVTKVGLKRVSRVASRLWLYYVVELVAALVEREVGLRMEQEGVESLALYPEKRASSEPTAGLVVRVLEGHRRHRLLDEEGLELQRFHDAVPEAAGEVLELLGIERSAYGLD
jgi:transposase